MTGKELVKRLQGQGWKLDRIRGSHHVMTKPGKRAVPIPVHGNRELPIGTLSAILKQTNSEKE
jgi:predicted RNA binding protein YcfA (HicA-like mRNA interferase family)